MNDEAKTSEYLKVLSLDYEQAEQRRKQDELICEWLGWKRRVWCDLHGEHVGDTGCSNIKPMLHVEWSTSMGPIPTPTFEHWHYVGKILDRLNELGLSYQLTSRPNGYQFAHEDQYGDVIAYLSPILFEAIRMGVTALARKPHTPAD